MTDYLRTPDTPADTLRDTLLGALVGLARSTSVSYTHLTLPTT